METKRTPYLPASVKRAGARMLQRTGPDTFSLGFALDTSQPWSAPGKGTAVVAALRTHFMDRAVITWGGTQAHAIFIRVL
jgi:hypothetical protein